MIHHFFFMYQTILSQCNYRKLLFHPAILLTLQLAVIGTFQDPFLKLRQRWCSDIPHARIIIESLSYANQYWWRNFLVNYASLSDTFCHFKMLIGREKKFIRSTVAMRCDIPLNNFHYMLRAMFTRTHRVSYKRFLVK